MLNTTIAKGEQARIIGQIQGIYSNADSLLKPTMNQVEFEKAIQEDKILFYFSDVVKSFSADALSKIEKEEDVVKKQEILKSSSDQLASLQSVEVVFDKMVKSIYVDVICLDTNTFKDNAINRKLDRVGQLVK
jgi:hypothetical protein